MSDRDRAQGTQAPETHRFSRSAGTGQAHLRILATTDIHMQVTAYDYYLDAPSDAMGMARTITLADAARAEAANAIHLDAGDILQGNPMGDLYAEAEPPDGVHPMIAAMNAAGVDAATIGNHDFNYGVDVLERALAGAQFPLVCANVTRGPRGSTPAEDRTLLPPTAILERQVIDGAGQAHPLKIGVFGVVPPQILNWDQKLLNGQLDARDMVEAAAAWVPALKAGGADIIVAISHSGIDPSPHRPGKEHVSLHLAEIPGVDAVVAGHQHKLFPSDEFTTGAGVDVAAATLAGKPAVMPGFWGTHLGVIDLLLTRTADGGWSVAEAEAALRPIARMEGGHATALTHDTPRVTKAVETAHAATLASIRRPVGQVSGPVTSYFALVADDPTVQLVARSQAALVRDAIAGTEWADLPLVSMTSPFKAGGAGGPYYYTHIEPGTIAAKDVADLYLYPNGACALLMTGSDLADWLERGAGIFRQVAEGAADAPLIDPDFATYNYDICVGLTYTIDVSKPPAFDAAGQRIGPSARIRDLAYNGRTVASGDRFVLATNSYRAGGGGEFPGAVTAKRLAEPAVNNREGLEAWIAAQGNVDPKLEPGWDFAPMPGTTVVFETGPGALGCAGDVPRRALTFLGDGTDGFKRFRLAL